MPRIHRSRRAQQKILAAIEAMEGRVLLSTITVNTFVDQIDSPGSKTVSLRDALALAASAQGGATVNVPAGNYKLALGELQVSQTSGNVDLLSSNGTATIDAGGNSRVLEVGQTAQLALDGFAITGGNGEDGGGIENDGSLTLRRCTISGNTASQHGGGIRNSTHANLKVTDSTVSANSCTSDVYWFITQGGGIENEGTAALLNCTIANNTANSGGGMYSDYASMTVDDCTITGNLGGGISGQSSPSFDCANSIIAGNFDRLSPDALDVAAYVNSRGHNLIGTFPGAGAWTASDLVGRFFPIDPRLWPLGNYGGPTQTIVPMAGSPALGAGAASLLPTGAQNDQRGQPRPTSGAIDIGAVQTQTPAIQISALTSSQSFPVRTTAKVTLGSFVAPANAGPFRVNVNWDDGSADSLFTMAAPGAIAPLQHQFLNGGTHIVSIAVTDRLGDLSNLAETRAVIIPAAPKYLVVNTTNDDIHDTASGTMSLRDAVNSANRSLGPVSIGFDPAVFAKSRTITLGSILNLGSNTFGPISIAAPAVGLTLSGGDIRGIMRVQSHVNVTLRGITLKNGRAGIQNDGTLALVETTISGDRIANTGKLLIQHSTISSNHTSADGGALYNIGQLTMSDSSVIDNHSIQGNGGGLFNAGVATITTCTFSGNRTEIGRVNSYVPFTFGGAIENVGVLVMTNSTMANNYSYGYAGAIDNSGAATITNCTITGNSASIDGGIVNDPQCSLKLANSIVSGNYTRNLGAPDAGGAITSLGHNLIGTTDFGSGWTSTDLTGTLAKPLSAHLAPLDYYGGVTATEFPLSGSPAIGAGDATLLPPGVTTDQRGFARVTSGRLDIGAVQLQRSGSISITPPPTQKVIGGDNTLIKLGTFSDAGGSAPFQLIVKWGDGSPETYFAVNKAGAIAQTHNYILAGNMTGTVYVIDGKGNISQPAHFAILASIHGPITVVVNSIADRLDPSGSSTITLRDAVRIADNSVGAVSIIFDPVVFARPQAIALHDSSLDLAHNVYGPITITAPRGGLILVGNGSDSVVTVDKGVTAAVRGIIFTGGGDSGIVNRGTLDISRCTISRNKSAYGGGIYNGGTLTVTQSTIAANDVHLTGGGKDGGPTGSEGTGIYNAGTLTVIDCSILNGTAQEPNRPGGGIVSGGRVMLAGSTISGNAGGGVFCFGPLTITRCRILNNTGTGVLSTGMLTMSDSTISGNSGNRSGAGVSIANGTITNCTISGNNSAASYPYINNGGGIAISGKVTVTNCTISGNSAQLSGGGVFVQDSGRVKIFNTTIAGNTALHGGGIYCSSDTSAKRVKLANTIVAANNFLADGSNADVAGAFSSIGYNLIGQSDGTSGWDPTDLLGASAHPLDAKLSALANHGGSTQTMIPLPGSPAIGAGSVALITKGITTDQRGKPRVVSGKVDIGAVEVQTIEANL